MNTDEGGGRPLAAARVVSSAPGRLRVRLPASAVRGERLAAAAQALTGRPGVLGVDPRLPSGSLVIEHDPAAAATVLAALGELGVTQPSPAPASAEGTDPEAARVLGGLSRANAMVAARTAGTDLRTLVPVGFGMLALRQFVRGEQRLADAPWYVLAWYASETFQKFHSQRRGQ